MLWPLLYLYFALTLQTTLLPLDPGYSGWLGATLEIMNKAQLQILKLDLQEKKINKNQFAEESEAVWQSMREVEQCNILINPH